MSLGSNFPWEKKTKCESQASCPREQWKKFTKEQKSSLKNKWIPWKTSFFELFRDVSSWYMNENYWLYKTVRKMSTIYNPTHTFVLVQGKTIFKITIHIIHIMSLVIGCCHISYILACRYKSGYKHVCSMLVGINVVMLELEMNHIHHEFI